MSKDFSPQMHWMVHLRYPEIHFSNIEMNFNGKRWMRFTEEELADHRKHEVLWVLASDIYDDIKALLSPDDFEELCVMLKNLVEADTQNKSTSSFPSEVTDWYYNRHDYYYHEPNDKAFMEYLSNVYKKE